MSENHLRVEGDINTTSARTQWQVENLSKNTLNDLKEDSKYFLHQSLSTPCLNMIEGVDGIYITDGDGKKYMDFHGNSVHQVGYKHPKVIQAVKDQLDDLPFSPRRYANKKATELAKALTDRAPGDLNKVLFAPGGTSAIGMAMKIARKATGRFRTISLWDAFHGASLDAISVGGESVFRSHMGPLLPGCEHIMPFNSYRCIFGDCKTCSLKCLDYLDYILERQRDVGAIIMETIRSTDVQVPPKAYYKRLRQICDQNDVLLILDEVPTALGRTGTFYAFEHYDIVPDMVVIGKGLGGGVFPMAAVIVREELDVSKDIAIGHYTHEKSPVGSAAALAAISVIESENLLEHSNLLGAWVLNEIKKWKDTLSIIGDIRGRGMLFAVELVLNRETKEKAIDAAEFVLYRCLSNGLSFKVSQGNVLTLVPPLVTTKEQMQEALEVLERAITDAQAKYLKRG